MGLAVNVGDPIDIDLPYRGLYFFLSCWISLIRLEAPLDKSPWVPTRTKCWLTDGVDGWMGCWVLDLGCGGQLLGWATVRTDGGMVGWS